VFSVQVDTTTEAVFFMYMPSIRHVSPCQSLGSIWNNDNPS